MCVCVRVCARASLLMLDADAEPFCGGWAHAGMARMARAVWSAAGHDVTEALKAAQQGSELVLAGHSLGAGVASLLTILLHEEHPDVVGLASRVRCFAFAPPPVFYTRPPQMWHPAESTISAFIHADDCVPFLSVDSGRKLMAGLRAVEAHCNEQPPAYYARIALGRSPADDKLCRVANAAMEGSDLGGIELAPPLRIPADSVVWAQPTAALGAVREQQRVPSGWRRHSGRARTWLRRTWRRWRGGGEYDAKVCSPERVAERGVGLSSLMFKDHFPDVYERALDELCRQHQDEAGESSTSSDHAPMSA